jgi:hypothetical protein
MASTIPLASTVIAAITAAISEEKRRIQEKKIEKQAESILSEIAALIIDMEARASLSFEHMIDNGFMNGPIKDHGLCKHGSVIVRVYDELTSKGYHVRVNEGKFKPTNRYCTYITVSLIPFEEEDYN